MHGVETNTFHIRRDLFVALLLMALTLAVFGQAIRFEFSAYDDSRYVQQNPAVMSGITWGTVVWAFTHSHFGFYMPLTTLSHAMDVQFFGLWAGGHHLSSVLLHALSAALLYLALVYMTGRPWECVLATVIFAVHPLRAESVAWVASRKDVVSGLFWMAAVWAYAWYARKPGWRRYLAVFLAMLASLMGKPVALTLPCVFLLLDYWPLGRLNTPRALPRLCLEKAPLFGLSGLFAALTLWSEGEIGTQIAAQQPSIISNAGLAAVAYARYIEHFLWPFHLAVYYPWSTMLMPKGLVCLWAVVLLGVTLLVMTLTKRRHLAVGWFWFLGVLAPVSGLLQISGVTLSDRYTYVPGIGLAIIVAWTASGLVGCLAPKAGRILWALLTAAVVIGVGVAGAWNAHFYHDSERLFTRALAVTRENDFAHTALGYVREQQQRFDEALAEYLEAVRIAPNYALWNGILADFLLRHGRPAEAVMYFQTALRSDAENGDYNTKLGSALLALGQYEPALAPLRAALKVEPGNAALNANLGVALGGLGRYTEARPFFDEALRLNPRLIDARLNYAVLLIQQGNAKEAEEQLQAVLQQDPNNASALQALKQVWQGSASK